MLRVYKTEHLPDLMDFIKSDTHYVVQKDNLKVATDRGILMASIIYHGDDYVALWTAKDYQRLPELPVVEAVAELNLNCVDIESAKRIIDQRTGLDKSVSVFWYLHKGALRISIDENNKCINLAAYETRDALQHLLALATMLKGTVKK